MLFRRRANLALSSRRRLDDGEFLADGPTAG
jgi:hypothetical protein